MKKQSRPGSESNPRPRVVPKCPECGERVWIEILDGLFSAERVWGPNGPEPWTLQAAARDWFCDSCGREAGYGSREADRLERIREDRLAVGGDDGSGLTALDP